MYDQIQGPDSSGMGAESGSTTSAKQQLAGQTVLSVFWCPSQPDVTTGVQKGGYSPSNYNGNMGTLIGNSGDNCYGGSITTPAQMAAKGGCMGADGIFFISHDDYMNYFMSTIICKIHPEYLFNSVKTFHN